MERPPLLASSGGVAQQNGERCGDNGWGSGYMKRIVVQDAQGVAPVGVSGRLRAGGKVLVAAIPAIMLVAVLSISLNLSYAALLFGTAPAEVQGSGLLMILVSTLVLTVVGAFASTLPVTLIAQDGALVAGLAAATAGAAAGMAAGAPGAGAATFLMALTLNSLLSGVVLLAVGQAAAPGLTPCELPLSLKPWEAEPAGPR